MLAAPEQYDVALADPARLAVVVLPLPNTAVHRYLAVYATEHNRRSWFRFGVHILRIPIASCCPSGLPHAPTHMPFLLPQKSHPPTHRNRSVLDHLYWWECLPLNNAPLDELESADAPHRHQPSDGLLPSKRESGS